MYAVLEDSEEPLHELDKVYDFFLIYPVDFKAVFRFREKFHLRPAIATAPQ